MNSFWLRRFLQFQNILFFLLISCVGKESDQHGLSFLLPLTGPLLKVGIIGDSLSQESDGFGLREKLGFRFTVTDYSVSGRYVPAWLQTIGTALTERQDLLILELGTNDVSGYPIDQFPKNYENLLSLIQSRSNAMILVTILPPTFQPGYRANILQINSYLKGLSSRYPTADMESVFLERENTIPLYSQTDLVHPNPVGYELMGTVYTDVIHKLYIK
ncbi:SGNH/GDSL hydrolase family protein [Leptospira mayottensis]|uniref:GDSL-like protein n=2 Tax=Leptospira mayottensis TaxID=1137606 RepID=A0AA87MK83_9LEPT|nr:SGNH/GDSL hydrolase family protein [Leptospira mayottensis]AXR60616.1 SGNH/GDSL hydrolase family protein [Leptospira mayottensis]AXR64428.1 SGNH/GDSL hydrolase family protein [Leptospira mayottensis]AXR68148.1 SGNH/GDSL hydrolase family protein [Leptospira mayottensis]AZQ02952.1 SGNH/GDSL hydrolase family protein [Leptospira mayottensis 200901116]EKR98418.1 GDSL-like protein [Leptospira mayottensis 200901122]